MQMPDRIKSFHNDLIAWRQDLHAHPELGFEEHRTSEFVASAAIKRGRITSLCKCSRTERWTAADTTAAAELKL
jgi:metal-dependent amidase/aminoacylase/carboxypeptidase family protein